MNHIRPPRGQNYYTADGNLRAILGRISPAAARRWDGHLAEFGGWVAEAVDPAADHTDRFAPPALESYDRDGALVNRVRHNPSWSAVSREVYRRGIVGLNYGDDPAPFAVTFAMGYLLAQADISLHCPVTMTGAVAYVLDRFGPADLAGRYLGEITRMDGEALSAGTWATELHGGSDVGASTTLAHREADGWRLNGLKWFTSNIGGGLAVATARPEGAPDGTAGLGLYLVPERLDGGGPNPMRIRRLKDKLGTRGVPTGEVELTDTGAFEIAPPPDGFRLMMEALGFSRLHNAMAAVGMQRRALIECTAYAAEREAFGRVITDYPMVQDEILKILVRLEAGAALAFEAVRAFDAADREGAGDGAARHWLRLATSLATCVTAEDAIRACRIAMEVMGGNAYTTDYVLHRLVRDAQVLTIWEGPANIQALEVLRMLGNRYSGLAALAGRVEGALDDAPPALAPLAGALDAAWRDCRDAVAHVETDRTEAVRHARRLMALMADVLAAALLLEEAALGWRDGDGRKALVLRAFIEDRIAPPQRRGIGRAGAVFGRHFAALAYDRPIAAEAALLQG